MRQGEIYWLHFKGIGSEPAGRRPALIVQHDRFNRSAIQTTVVAAVTSFGKNGNCAGTGGVFRMDRANVLEFVSQFLED